MKRIISIAIAAIMLFVSFAVVVPAGAMTPSISTDKNTYLVGEPIIVSAQSDNSSGKDWVGIAPKEIYTVGTIAWDYLNDVGEGYDITKAANRSAHEDLDAYQDFPEGRYVVYLIPDDLTLRSAVESGKVLASTEIVIAADPDAILKAPLEVTYELDDATSGLADGTLSLKLPKSHSADDIYMWWANEDGILEDYTRLARFKVPSRDTTEFTYEMTPNTLIPAEATELWVYTYSDLFGMSEDCVVVKLPEGAGYDMPTKEPIIEFQVISDIHIGRSEAAENFKQALLDIAANSPNSSGIFANGDLIDEGYRVELWDEFWSIYESVDKAPDLFPIIGNHEYMGMNYNNGLASFLENIRMPEGYAKPDGTQYYDVWVDGYHFIFLADARSSGCDVGEEQYDWLEARLAEKSDERPVFLFFHQPMKNTVAGSMESEGWWEIEDDARLREILDAHPEIFFFNGHTHWILDSYNSMYGGGEEAAIFNTSSVSYLWQSYDVSTGVHQDGSEGLYVRVYSDRVLVLGRDFENGKWVSSAQFVLNGKNSPADDESAKVNNAALAALFGKFEKLNAADYTEESWAAVSNALEGVRAALEEAKTQDEVNLAKSALEAAIKGLIEKSADDGNEDEPDETPSETPTEIPANTPTEPAPTEPAEKTGGCGSSISALGVLLVCISGCAVINIRKNRK